MPHEPRPRPFRLPRHEELDKEQDAILEARLEGNALITGGPGSGKTIMAILLAGRLGTPEHRSKVLVYNKTLQQACMGQGGNGNVSFERSLAWVKRIARQSYKLKYKSYDPPWVQLEDHFYEADENDQPITLPKVPHIVDEGQDMELDFFRFLHRHELQVIVTADQNQRITSTPSTEDDIILALEVPAGNQFTLRGNHRNTRAIAALAAHFHVGPGGPPEPPAREGTAAPVLIETDDLFRELRRILRYSRDNPGRLIGILTHNRDRQMAICEVLREEAQALDLAGNWIRHYNGESGDARALDFAMGGVIVLCAQSAKGLEFDDVVVAPINDYPALRNQEDWKTLFYVSLTRARERVYLLREAGARCEIAEYLPDDQAILKRVCRVGE